MQKKYLMPAIVILLLIPFITAFSKEEPPSSYSESQSNGTIIIKAQNATCTSSQCPVYVQVCDQDSQSDNFDLTFFGLPFDPIKLYLWDTITIQSTETFPNATKVTFFNTNTSQNENKTVTDYKHRNDTIYAWEPTGGQSLNKGVQPNTAKSGITIGKNQCKDFRANFRNIFGAAPWKYGIGGISEILDPLVTSKFYFAGNNTYPFGNDNNNTLTNASVANSSIAFPQTGGGTNLVLVEDFDIANGAICGTNNWSQVAAYTCLSVVSKELDFNNDQFAEQRRRHKESFNYRYTVRTDAAGGVMIFCVDSDENIRCHSGLAGAGYTFRIDGNGDIGIYTDGTSRNTTGGAVSAATNTFVRVQYNDSNDNRLKMRAWTNTTAEPGTWNLLYRPSEAINNAITGKFIGWGSVSAGGTHDGIVDNLMNYTSSPLTANTSDNAQYFRSIQFPASDTIKRLNFTYRGVIGADRPDFNASCNSGLNWGKNISNTTTEFNCTTPGNNLVWDVRLAGSDTAMKITNVTFDLQFNEVPYAERFGLSHSSNLTGISNFSLQMNTTDLDAQDEVEVNVTWFVNETFVSSRNFSLKTVCDGSAGGDIMGMGGCGGQNASKSVNLTLLGNPSTLYGNFSGGDIVNVTVTISDRWDTRNRVYNGSNSSFENVTSANITFPNGTMANPTASGLINLSWNASTALIDSSTNVRYNVSISEDAGATWAPLANRIGGVNLSWTVYESYQTDYRFRISPVYGYNATTDTNFTTASLTIGNQSITIENRDTRGDIGFNATLRQHVEVSSGFGTNITQVNISIFHANGTRFDVERRGDENGSTRGRMANFSALVGNGTYTVEVLARNTAGNTSSTNATFTYEDIVQVLPLPVEIPIVLDPSETYRFNITLEQNTNATVAYTSATKNFSAFFTNEINSTSTFNVVGKRNGTDPLRIPANITSSGATPDDTYRGGYFLINRTLDEKLFKIRFIIGINPPRGEITLLKSAQTRCDKNTGNCNFIQNNLSTADTKTFFWLINNTGSFALSNCEAHFVDFAGSNTSMSGASLTLSGTTVQPNQTQTVTLDVITPAQGTYNSTIESTCHATEFGFVDSLSKDSIEVPEVSYTVVAAPGQGSSPPGGAPPGGAPPAITPAQIAGIVANITTRCGDNVCTEGTETFFSCFQDCGTTEQLFKQVKTLQVIFGIGTAAILLLILLQKPKKKKEKKP